MDTTVADTISAKIAANAKSDPFDRSRCDRLVLTGLGYVSITRPGRSRVKEHRFLTDSSRERLNRLLARYGEFVGGFTWKMPEKVG